MFDISFECFPFVMWDSTNQPTLVFMLESKHEKHQLYIVSPKIIIIYSCILVLNTNYIVLYISFNSFHFVKFMLPFIIQQILLFEFDMLQATVFDIKNSIPLIF